jgi:hypothetical protein
MGACPHRRRTHGPRYASRISPNGLPTQTHYERIQCHDGDRRAAVPLGHPRTGRRRSVSTGGEGHCSRRAKRGRQIGPFYWMQVNAHGAPNVQVQRVIAHRRNWFDAPGPGITAGGLVVGPAARTHLHKRTARPPSRSKRKSAEPVADIRHALLVDARSLCGRTWASRGARTAGSGRALCHRQDRSPAEHPREGKAIVPISAVACVASCPLVNGS